MSKPAIGSASAGQLSILQTNFTFNHGVINAWLLTGASGDTRYRFQTQGTMARTVQAGVNLQPNQKLEDEDYMLRPTNPLVATFEASLLSSPPTVSSESV